MQVTIKAMSCLDKSQISDKDMFQLQQLRTDLNFTHKKEQNIRGEQKISIVLDIE